MSILAIPINTTCVALSGGTATISSIGSDTVLTVSNTGAGDWLAGDRFSVLFTDSTSGIQTLIGNGNVTGQAPTYALTFNNKMYFLAGSTLFFSALASAGVFNDLNAAGNGYIQLGNQAGTPENQMAMAAYQGYLAIIARRTVQVWAIDPDPAQNAKQQVLTNIGTVAALTVQSVGDRDVLMLSDSGVRSIRPRVASMNAEVIDLGTPVDALVQAALVTLTESEKATACAVIEPSANRYMLFVPGHSGADGKIYVLSSFPNSQIEAWSSYSPTYQIAVTPTSKTFAVTAGKVYAWIPAAAGDTLACGTVALTRAGSFTAPVGATTAVVTGTAAGTLSQRQGFAPEKFSTYLGQVYCRAGDNVFLYGGADNNTYDFCGVTGRIPFLDCDAPSVQKDFQGIDSAFEGDWNVAVSTDYVTKDFTRNIYRSNASSFQRAKVPMNRRATHLSLEFTELSAGYARLSSLLVHFKPNQSK